MTQPRSSSFLLNRIELEESVQSIPHHHFVEMAHRSSTPSVLDLSTEFSPVLVGNALARLWAVEGCVVVPTLDEHGLGAHCPITLEPMEDPVMTADGTVYESAAILNWLGTSTTSPCTNVVLRHKSSFRLTPMRDVINTLLLSEFSNFADKRAKLRETTKQAQEAHCNLRDCGPMRRTLCALEIRLAECDTEIQEWQAAIAEARDVADKLRHEVAVRERLETDHAWKVKCEAAALLIQKLWSASRDRKVKCEAAALRIQKCWSTSRKLMALRSKLRSACSRLEVIASCQQVLETKIADVREIGSERALILRKSEKNLVTCRAAMRDSMRQVKRTQNLLSRQALHESTQLLDEIHERQNKAQKLHDEMQKNVKIRREHMLKCNNDRQQLEAQLKYLQGSKEDVEKQKHDLEQTLELLKSEKTR